MPLPNIPINLSRNKAYRFIFGIDELICFNLVELVDIVKERKEYDWNDIQSTTVHLKI